MTPNSLTLIDLSEPIERQRDKLLKICDALMQRVEQNHDDRSAAYTQFQRAVLLEEQVRERTRDLEHECGTGQLQRSTIWLSLGVFSLAE